ncbi:retrovirus-related pol polyprotein from transposon TNT 1-94 [Tanacetum coccineum]
MRECKYDKILYDKAYNDVQQKIERLQAQLGDLKGKSKDTPCVSETLDPFSHKLENENVELEFQVLNYAKENAHLKTTYKNLFDSITVTRTQTKTIIDSLQNKLHDTIYENAKLRAQLFDKVSAQKDITKGTSRNTKFANQSTLGTKLYSVTPFPNSKIIPKVVEMNDLSNPVTSNSKCLITFNHDVCVLNYVNGMNSRNANQSANVSNVANQKKHKPKVRKSKKLGSKERLASPTPSKPRSCLRWSPTGRIFDLKGKIIASSESECQSDCSNGDNACTSNPQEPTIKRFPNSTSFLGRITCYVQNLEGVDLLKGNCTTNLYTINLHEMASASPICLMARATSTNSWLWHQCLSHLNFDTINDLANDDLEKSKKASHPPKPVPNSKQRLHLLHMDLCGPMRVESINRKRYVLVIVDDYSRYTWVHFLRSKDEALEEIKIFLKKITVLLQASFIIAPLFVSYSTWWFRDSLAHLKLSLGSSIYRVWKLIDTPYGAMWDTVYWGFLRARIRRIFLMDTVY